MGKKQIIIDAAHTEETRVAVLEEGFLQEYDFETTSKKQIKGNVYLAKIIRVEPSLQAAFVEYGGNRHGFLAFSEIHPDYFKIPVADKELFEHKSRSSDVPDAPDDEIEEISKRKSGESSYTDEMDLDTGENDSQEISSAEKERQKIRKLRTYKIQEVIKKDQIVLAQVVKEERGMKGAALTTYMAIPGRYCVLMPNTRNSGGVSRKIDKETDRKRLRTILDKLDIPEKMSIIIRTAGEGRSEKEINRDFDYLINLWEEIRGNTLKANAPAIVYEEGNLIRRTIRDSYTDDVSEIQIFGDEALETAKSFMKILMPSHVKRVKKYKKKPPIFLFYNVETQLEEIHSVSVNLPSGGSLVINPTEALVSIDINSGRATKARDIEDTALQTNIEAADEVARQMRLRDLAGLVVIDFIDMEINKNQYAVEKRMREAVRSDRAKVQIGRISNFGLMELSRQRLRPSLLELHTKTCSHCGGRGVVHSIESCAVQSIRALEQMANIHKGKHLVFYVAKDVAGYIFSQKREDLKTLESRYKLTVTLEEKEGLGLYDVEFALLKKDGVFQSVNRPELKKKLRKISPPSIDEIKKGSEKKEAPKKRLKDKKESSKDDKDKPVKKEKGTKKRYATKDVFSSKAAQEKIAKVSQEKDEKPISKQKPKAKPKTNIKAKDKSDSNPNSKTSPDIISNDEMDLLDDFLNEKGLLQKPERKRSGGGRNFNSKGRNNKRRNSYNKTGSSYKNDSKKQTVEGSSEKDSQNKSKPKPSQKPTPKPNQNNKKGYNVSKRNDSSKAGAKKPQGNKPPEKTTANAKPKESNPVIQKKGKSWLDRLVGE